MSSAVHELGDVFTLLCSQRKTERDKGSERLSKILGTSDRNDFRTVADFFQAKINELMSKTCLQFDFEDAKSAAKSGEISYGVLTGLKLLIAHTWCTEEIVAEVLTLITENLSHKEYSIRFLSGQCLGELCRRFGLLVYSDVKEKIFSGVKDNLEEANIEEELSQAPLTPTLEEQSSPPESPTQCGSPRTTALLQFEKLSESERKQTVAHGAIRWKHLETWMRCLKLVVDGCGGQFSKCIDKELLDVVFKTLTHTNRYVREAGYHILTSLLSCITANEGENFSEMYGPQIAEQLARGLADDMSSVRLAASIATRLFFCIVPKTLRTKYFPSMLPRMCLNRYFIAESVRIYSQDTWKQVTENRGRFLVHQYIDSIVDYYTSLSGAENHAVREAACACIAELSTKLEKESVRPHVGRLLETLKVCFRDEIWPVRDAACLSVGSYISQFPEECKTQLVQLMPMFKENLRDNILCVRVGAAEALTIVAKTYTDSVTADLLGMVEEAFKELAMQRKSSELKVESHSLNNAHGQSCYQHLADKDEISDLTVPGQGCDTSQGYCVHSLWSRPPEPWEKADGCIHLMAQLTSVSSLHQSLADLLPALASAASHKHYPQHLSLLETLCKKLPEIAKNLGSRLFKPHLELFFDSLFYSLVCDNSLTSSAASQCLNSLGHLIGPNILKGRVEHFNPDFVRHLEANTMIAPM